MNLEAIKNWIEIVNAKRLAYQEKAGHVTRDVLEIDPGGKKFVRIVSVGSGNRSAYCFIEIATGNILKPDGWKGPAKGVRGNIADPDGSWGKGVGPYGAAYAYR